MTLDHTSQAWITLFGGFALWMMNCRGQKHRRAGVVFGLLAQPAWYIQMYLHDQWLMLPVYCVYTAAWVFGLWNLWIRAEKPAGEEAKP